VKVEDKLGQANGEPKSVNSELLPVDNTAPNCPHYCHAQLDDEM